MAGPAKKSRKFGRHDQGPHHHTPEQALRNKAKRVLQSCGAAAYIKFCDAHRLFGRVTQAITAKVQPRKHDALRDARRRRKAA